MQATAVQDIGGLWRTRNFVLFAAVVLMNYTLAKPSPVDLAFILAIALSLLVRQRLTMNFIFLSFLAFSWMISFQVSSIDLLGNSEVRFELVQKTFVVFLGIGACYIASSWRTVDYERFLKVYVFSCIIASLLGTAGFLTGLELLTWDGRAKGLISDPNMYGSFLVPGVLACMYFATQRSGRRRVLALGALLIVLLGLLLAFSRAAIGALMVCAVLYMVFINRHNLARLAVYVVAGFAIFFLVFGLVFVFGPEEFSAKVMDRLTLAKDYDLGREGRYYRYVLAVPMILANPLGIGVAQTERFFAEPIHNIFISSFLNYGWLAGVSWLSIFLLSAVLAWKNWTATKSPLSILLYFCFLSQALCASLHEGEHWRQLWLYLGLLWGFGLNTQTPRPPRLRAALQQARAPQPA